MANISIRNLDDSVKEALRLQAAAAHCSLEEFLRRCLTAAALQENAEGRDGAAADAAPPAAAAKAREYKQAQKEYGVLNADSAAGDAERYKGRGEQADIAALRDKNIVLIIGGSVAAYKALELIRLLRRAGANLRVIMTKAAQHFITPLLASALAGGRVYADLFSREDEQDIGHIRLARFADIAVVAAASASRMAKMAAGQGDDLAGAVLLASAAPVLVAPAMNPAMWAHKATQRNLAALRQDGCHIVGPEYGTMAESGEEGLGRMSEPADIIAALADIAAELPPLSAEKIAQAGEKGAESRQAAQHSGIAARGGALAGRHIIVTSGPTYEPLDPVRYFSNHSSGKQGHGLAAALAALGARVTLISGPVELPDPFGAEVVHIKTARQMLAAVRVALPADAAVFVAAVADWRPQYVFADKLKKNTNREANAADSAAAYDEHETGDKAGNYGLEQGAGRIKLTLLENPDILAEIAHLPQRKSGAAFAANTRGQNRLYRPSLVIGFAAETADLMKNAAAKLAKKGADWIIANNVAEQQDGGSIMGGDNNAVTIITGKGAEQWREMPKTAVSAKLAEKIADFFNKENQKEKR